MSTLQKVTVRIIKRQGTDWAKYMLNTYLIVIWYNSKIYKVKTQQENNQLILKWAKDLSRHITKLECR